MYIVMFNPVILKIKGVENKKNSTILRMNAETLSIKTTVETLGIFSIMAHRI